MKGVFDIKPESGYDDSLTEGYQFPTRRHYMAAAQAVVGDWILYRGPKRNGGGSAYIGVARVVSVERDAPDSKLAYAKVADFFQFEPPVPFAGASSGRYWEASLRGSTQSSACGQFNARELARANFR